MNNDKKNKPLSLSELYMQQTDKQNQGKTKKETAEKQFDAFGTTDPFVTEKNEEETSQASEDPFASFDAFQDDPFQADPFASTPTQKAKPPSAPPPPPEAPMQKGIANYYKQEIAKHKAAPSSSGNTAAAIATAAAVGTAAAVAATTTFKTKGNTLHTDTNLGPLKGHSYIGESKGDFVQGKSSGFSLGGFETSKSKESHIGKGGFGQTTSSALHIPGVGGVSETGHFGIGERGNIAQMKYKANFFGEKVGFNATIPAGGLSKVAEGVGRTIGSAGSAVAQAAPAASQLAMSAASAIGDTAKTAGPGLTKAAIQGLKLAGQAGKASIEVGKVGIEVAGTILSLFK